MRHLWSILIISIFLIVSSCGQQSIPPRILANLKNVKTLQELERKMNVISTSRSPTGGSTTFGRSRGGGIGGVAPSASRSRAGTVADPYEPGVTVIDDFKEGNESCKIVNICVPLPISQQTGVFLFPKCIELPQCMGGCCTRGDTCYPKEIKKVIVKYKSWLIVDDSGDGQFEFLGDKAVDMYQHQSCSCTHCVDQPVCNARQELSNCQCQCRNQAEKSRCQSAGLRWSDEKCECGCTKICPPGYYLNPNTCSCENVRGYDSPALDDTDSYEHQTSGYRARDSRNWNDDDVDIDHSRRSSYSRSTNRRRHNGGRPTRH